MSIHNPQKYLQGVWDWGILRGCFGESRIEPTDLDGMVERNGRFLVLEAKSPGASIPLGQKLTFEAMQKNGAFTVLIVWGETNAPQSILRVSPHASKYFPSANMQLLREIVSRWYAWAERQIPPPTGADSLIDWGSILTKEEEA